MQRIDKLNALLAQQLRSVVMADLANRAASVPPGWNVQVAESSMTLTSPDRKKIIKIDAQKVYTLDIKKPDGTYKSARFPCTSIEDAWGMAFQAIKIHRCADAVH